MLADVGAQTSHSLHDLCEINGCPGWDANSKIRRFANRGRSTGRPDDSLGGDATHVQTIPAHQVLFNQRYFGAQTGGAHGRNQACSARADDDEIVARGRRRVFPVVRVDVGYELSVVVVPWKDRRLIGLVHFTFGCCAELFWRVPFRNSVINIVTATAASKPTP